MVAVVQCGGMCKEVKKSGILWGLVCLLVMVVGKVQGGQVAAGWNSRDRVAFCGF